MSYALSQFNSLGLRHRIPILRTHARSGHAGVGPLQMLLSYSWEQFKLGAVASRLRSTRFSRPVLQKFVVGTLVADGMLLV